MDDPTTPANDRFIQYTYGGGSLDFNYDFPVHEASSVAMYLNNLRMQFTADYTVTVSDDFDGGTVSLLWQPKPYDIITIVGDTPLTRTEYYGNEPVVNPHALDTESEKTIMRLQQINTKVLGCLKNQLNETELGNTNLPLTDNRKGKVAAWDGTTGELSYFGDGAMDEIYLKRTKNLADISDVDAARDNLHLIDGRELMNNGRQIPYRRILEFNQAFKLADSLAKTVVSLNVVVTNIGSGIPLVTKFSEDTIWARTLRAVGNLSLDIASDGSLLLSDSTARGYSYQFTEEKWDDANHIEITFERHRITRDSSIIVNVRDNAGYDVQCNVMVTDSGTVHLYTNYPFSGYAIIYGGIVPFSQGGVMINPMVMKGDIIYGGAEDGTPFRLPVGRTNQALCVGSDNIPEYKTLGEVAWKNANIPNGVPVLDNNCVIPAELLPISTMTYKGTFGSSESTTGGDLPTIGILDGDIYVAGRDYVSAVAGRSFLIGQWAIYNGVSWDNIPMPHPTVDFPIGGVVAFAGTTVPQNYLACNGYALDKIAYAQLFNVIGTIYNTGSEVENKFSIPNYNNERRFLQGATTAGSTTKAGLPNITGWFGIDQWAPFGGCIYHSGQGHGAKGGSSNNKQVSIDAHRSSAVYGSSNTVQPEAQNVVFIIRYQ